MVVIKNDGPIGAFVGGGTTDPWERQRPDSTILTRWGDELHPGPACSRLAVVWQSETYLCMPGGQTHVPARALEAVDARTVISRGQPSTGRGTISTRKFWRED